MIDCFVSVVAPLWNDSDILDAFVEDTTAMLACNYANYELVLVDDGSNDDTRICIEALLRAHDCIRYIPLSRRFGQEIAISAGLESVIGDFTVVMLPDSDPPKLVPEMVEIARAGSEIVFGVRKTRTGDPWWLRAGAAGFYWLCNRILGLHLPRNATHFRVLSRRAVNALIQVRDQRRYLRTLSGYIGFEDASFAYEPVHRRTVPRRKSGGEAISLAVNIVVSNSTRPLRYLSWLGVIVAGLNVLYIGYIALIYLFKSDVAEGWVTQSMQSAVMFFFLFLTLAVLGEYVGQLLDEVRARPLYVARQERVSSVLIADGERVNVVGESGETNVP